MNETADTQKTPRLSILVAAYNIVPYLDECMQSILRYEGNDIEVILVDDASTDNTWQICEGYARRDPRVSAIRHETNRRVSGARNTAILAARGEWSTMIDGDDRLSDGAVPAMLDCCGFDGEMVVFGSLAFQDDQAVHYWRPKEYTMTDPAELRRYCIDSMTDKYAAELYGNPNLATVWGKIFRTSFLREPKHLFDTNVTFSQDREHLFRYVPDLTKIRFVPAQVYEYRKANQGSVTHLWHPDAVEKQTAVMDAMLKAMQDNHKENDPNLRRIYHYVGLFGIVTRCVMLGVCHPECEWSYGKRLNALKELRRLPWAAESLEALPDFKDEKMPWRSVLVCMRMRLYAPILLLKTARRFKRRSRQKG